MVRIGLISNVRSQHNKQGISAIDEVVAGKPDVIHRRLSDVDEFSDSLTEFARSEVGLVVINGGDGTVQAALTALLENRPFETNPTVAILPRGMTNMTAADVGLRGPVKRSLAKLIDNANSDDLTRHTISRHVLRVDSGPMNPPQCGMFLGAAGIVRGIEWCRSKVHTRGLTANWANAVTLVGMLIGRLLSPRHSKSFGGDDIVVSIDGAPPELATRLLVLATTLDRLVLGSRPFWHDSGNPIRFTSIPFPAPGLLCKAPKILYGVPNREIGDKTYISCGAEKLVVRMDCAYTLDGELFQASHDQPLVVTAADSLDFLRY